MIYSIYFYNRLLICLQITYTYYNTFLTLSYVINAKIDSAYLTIIDGYTDYHCFVLSWLACITY